MSAQATVSIPVTLSAQELHLVLLALGELPHRTVRDLVPRLEAAAAGALATPPDSDARA